MQMGFSRGQTKGNSAHSLVSVGRGDGCDVARLGTASGVPRLVLCGSVDVAMHKRCTATAEHYNGPTSAASLVSAMQPPPPPEPRLPEHMPNSHILGFSHACVCTHLRSVRSRAGRIPARTAFGEKQTLGWGSPKAAELSPPFLSPNHSLWALTSSRVGAGGFSVSRG